MIKIKINDTIIDIIDKINTQKTWDIVLDFPLWHPTLHNYISLKILKSKVWDRKLIIATNDRIWKKIGKRLGIEYSLIKNKDFLEEKSQEKLMQHNFTFWEYFKFQIKSYKQELLSSLDANKKLNSLWKYSRIYQEKTSIHIFIWALLLSLVIFLFVYYFAISKSYIHITPEVIVKKEAHNFIFKENIENTILWNNKLIKINILSETIHSSDTFSATEIVVNEKETARWKIILYNSYNQAQTIIPKTRLQDDSGIIFEIPVWTQIPWSVIDNFWVMTPWSVELTVYARSIDETWSYIWERGNIKSNSKLILPWLDQEGQKNIYAQSIEDFTWGSNNYEKVISSGDIKLAKSIFTEKMKSEVITSIKNNILLENQKNNSQIDILSWGKSIIYSEPLINIEDWIEAWIKKDKFSMNGSITAYVYTYNKDNITQKLKTLLSERNLIWIEKISHIDTSSVRMSEIIYTKQDPFEMKATFEIEALFLHDFLHRENTYISQLRSEIRWIKKEDAEKILLNNPKISNVRIELRPFFTKNISNIYNNIIFKIE